MKLWSSGGRLQALPQKRYADLELGRHAADLGTWRCSGMEVLRYAAGVSSPGGVPQV